MIEPLLHDLRHAARSMRRTPGFSLAAVLTLALGIGANTTIFTVLDAVVLRPLPVAHARELFTIYETTPDAVPDADGGTGRYLRFSHPRFLALQRALGSDGTLMATTRNAGFVVRLPGGGSTERRGGQLVSAGFFETLGVPMTLGRPLLSEDLVNADRQATAVISDEFWRTALGSRSDIVGQTLHVNSLPVTIVGVAGPGFAGVWNGGADIWMPLTLQAALRYSTNRSAYASADATRPWIDQDRIAWLNVIARVPRASVPRAAQKLQQANRAAVQSLADALPGAGERQEMRAHTLVFEPFSRGFSFLRGAYSTPLWVLAGLVALVLLVTCANIANLLLVRATARAREMGIRLAVGATNRRLVRQSLIESLLLAAIGGAAGVVLAVRASAWLAATVLATPVGRLPPAFTADWRALVFTVAVSIGTALLFGIVPALRSTRTVVQPGHVLGSALSRRSSMVSMRPLVAFQLALSLVVVCAAVLLGQTLVNFARLDPGFSTTQVVAVAFDSRSSGFTRDQLPALNVLLAETAAAVPGVARAAVANCGLLGNCSSSSGYRIESADAAAVIGPVSVSDNSVGPGYFATVGIPVLDGREFDARDTATGQQVAIVSQSFARRYFKDVRAVGRHIGGERLDIEIVGVVGDVRGASLRDVNAPTIYLPIGQKAADPYATDLAVRVSGATGPVSAALGAALRRAAPALVVGAIEPMTLRIERNIGRERLVAWLAFAFAALATFLSCLGLYGVLSYSVARRTAELGVRSALGAASRELAALVLRDGLRTIGVGVLAGAAGAAAAARLLQSLLFGVRAGDAGTYVVAMAVMTTVALIACYLPARRAARVNPVSALRAE